MITDGDRFEITILRNAGNLLSFFVLYGGKHKFARSTQRKIKLGGYFLGVWNAININLLHSEGQITNFQRNIEQGSNVITTTLGLPGAAWGFGWEMGREITNMNWYREAKFIYWYNNWEGIMGPPSQTNIKAWDYFFQNHIP